LRTLVRGSYDVQKIRIQMGNRIVANWKAKLGQEPSQPEKEMDKEGKELLDALRAQYKSITEGLLSMPKPKDFKGTELISTFTEFCLVAQFLQLEEAEKEHFNRMEKTLDNYRLWTEYLKDVKGVGRAMAGVMLSEFDIHKAKYASSLHKYAGLDVAEDGRGRSRRKEHLIDVEYTTKDGKTDTRKSITFNPFLKTKLIGVLGPSFLRAGREDNPYAEAYYNYKNRLENHAVYKDKTKGHRHNMAIRYAVKIFLIDLYAKWKEIEGLPAHPPYAEAKLGLKHGA